MTNLIQAAWVVEDLQAAMRQWIDTQHVGPFYVFPHCHVDNVRYRGEPATLDFSAALAQAGPMQIELIQQHDAKPSAYRDMYPLGKEGFHHVCVMTSELDAVLERYRLQGAVPVTSGEFGDMRYAYVDTRSSLGHMTEVIEDRDSIKGVFKLIADAAVNWDGTDPIRSL